MHVVVYGKSRRGKKGKKTFRTSYILEQNIQMSICTFDPTITELNLNTIPEI